MRHLGALEQLLLLTLAHAGPDASGGVVRTLIAERTGRTLSPGAIYTAFGRLDRRGLVSSALGDPTPLRGGKRKRLYTLLPAGTRALRETQGVLAEMSRGLRQMLTS